MWQLPSAAVAKLFVVRQRTAKSTVNPLTALTSHHYRPSSLPFAGLGWRTAQSFAVRFYKADNQEDLCWHVFSRTVCRPLADGKGLCCPGSVPLPSAMADDKEADSSSATNRWRERSSTSAFVKVLGRAACLFLIRKSTSFEKTSTKFL